MKNNTSNSLYCATVLYPFKNEASFDFELYTSVLIPEYVALLGENCVRYEVRRGITAPGKQHVDFVCIANFWLRSAEESGAAMANPEMQQIMQKIAAFTEIIPLRQFDEVINQ